MMKLKPCPFCGGDRTFVSKYTTNFFQDRYHVRCEDCRSVGASSTDIKQAIEAWDRRADDRRVDNEHTD